MIRLGLGGVPRSIATIVCLLMAGLVIAIAPRSATKDADARSPATKEAGARPPRRSPIDVPEEFRPDFSKSASRGIGVRLDHLNSGLYVDLRIKGYAGQEPARRANEGQRETRVEFAPSPGIKVIYEAARNEVKETIVLSEPGPEEFRYKIASPGLRPRQDGQTIVFDSSRHLGLFRIHGLRVWDAAAQNIPASLTLDGSETLVLRLDHEAVLRARLPITIDPTISGQLGQAPHARRLFETSDGKLVLFHMVSVSGSWSLAYNISSDGGDTWSEPILIGTVPGVFGAAAEKGPDDSFYITYPAGPEGSAFIAFRAMTRLSNGSWSVGIENSVGTGDVMLWPRPSIADLGQGTTGRKLAIGFVRKNALGADEYAISFSDDSGQTWSTAFKCDDAQIGTLAAQGARLFCIVQGDTKDLEAREWLGLSWGLPTTIPVGYFPCGAFMPSSVTTDDGRLHLVVSASPVNDCLEQRVRYASISQGSSEWTVRSVLGQGTLPVISTMGSALEVFAQVGVGYGESKIHSYVTRDGITWSEGRSFSGGPFAHVLDINETWAFQDDFDSGDALFSITDSEGQWGNRIGISSALHKLDSHDKKLSMSFIAQSGGSVSSLILWNTANSSPTYRIGIQSDCAAVSPSCQGTPSGSWLLDLALSGSWGDVTPSNSSYTTSLTVTLGHSVDLSPGVRYHIVVQPVSDPTGVNNPTANKWMAVQTVGADAGAEGSMRVLGNSGTGWDSVVGEVPRLIATNSTDSPFIQDLQPNWWFPSADKYSIPGESFVVPRSFVPTSLKVYLTRDGQTDSAVTVRILNQSGTQLWSHETTPAGEGWLSLPVSGVTLTEGSRYRLVVDSPAGGSPWNHWNLGTSNGLNHWNLGTSNGWDGNSSGLTRAFDRPGVNDRTAEASSYFSSDIWAFNSSTSDALYLGDNKPFDFARIWAQVHLGVSMEFAYWNGSSWTPLTITGSSSNFSGMRIAEWQPPADWSQVTVDGRNAYWIRVTNSAESVTPLHTFRTTSIRNFRYPTAAPRGSSHIPVAWEDNDFGRIVTWAYDVLSPAVSDLMPSDGSNTIFKDQPLLARIRDEAGSGVALNSITFSLQDVTPGSTASATSHSAIAYEPTTGWAKTAPLPLIFGHTYRLGIRVVDMAGNALEAFQRPTSEGGGFLVTELQPQPTTASIVSTECAIEDDPESALTNRAVCSDLPLHYASGSIWVGGTKHGYDLGYVEHTVSLISARLETMIDGVPNGMDAYNPSDPSWHPKSQDLGFRLPDSNMLGQTLAVDSYTRIIPKLIVNDVPATWQTASLRLPTTATTGLSSSIDSTPWTNSCPDPSLDARVIACEPDFAGHRYGVVLKSSEEGGPNQSVATTAQSLLSPYNANLRTVNDVRPNRIFEVELPLYEANQLGFAPDTKAITRLGLLEQSVETDIAFRKLLSLPADRLYVAGLYLQPDLTTGRRRLGALFTPSEEAEVLARLDLQKDSIQVDEYIDETGSTTTFAGSYIDHAAGGKLVVRFTSGVELHRDALLARVLHPARLEVTSATKSLSELETRRDEVRAHDSDFQGRGFLYIVTGVDVENNNVYLSGREIQPGACASVRLEFPDVRIGCNSSDILEYQERIAPERSRIRDIPPWTPGIPIFFHGGGDAFGPCTLGFAVERFVSGAWRDNYNISAAHCSQVGNTVTHNENTLGNVISFEYRLQPSADMIAFPSQPWNWAMVYRDYPNMSVVNAQNSRNEKKGWIVCMSGAVSFHHCGTVYDPNAHGRVTDGRSVAAEHTEFVTVMEDTDQKLTMRGDSGSAVYVPAGIPGYPDDVAGAGVLKGGHPAYDPGDGSGQIFRMFYYAHLTESSGSFVLEGYRLHICGC